MITESWLPSEGIDATDELMDIIKSDSSLSVLAGAGSGKTELLAQKASYLLQTNTCPWPKKILCLSFKTEARLNIAQRVKKRCGVNFERFDSYTFHAFCKSIVDRFKGVLPQEVRPIDGYDLVTSARDASGISKVHLNTIIGLALDIVDRRGDIRSLFSSAYAYVFIDEFQDTTCEQYELVKELFLNTNTKILCVGDLNQSIMLWANASPAVFQDYQDDFCAETKILSKNYRASPDIQRMLNKFLEYVQDENQEFIPIQTESNNCTIACFDDDVLEANYISLHIKALVESGIEEEEICVLTRQQSSQYTQLLRHELSVMGIRNLDMSDLQDILKEPIGILFTSLLKVLTVKKPKVWSELCDFHLSLNQVSWGDDSLEEALINGLSNHISEAKARIVEDGSIDSMVEEIKVSIGFIGVNQIIARWPQYKSPEFFKHAWNTLVNHLNYTADVSESWIDAALMFNAENSVQLMNVHKCKGLEYKVVIFQGLEDEAFWSFSDDNFEGKCTMFVALSRAKKQVFITISGKREHRVTQYHDNRVSHFTRVGFMYEFLTQKCGFKELVV